MRVALIPARGGSKRIPKKNIKKFNNKAVINYPLEAIKKSGLFDRVFVSTDSKEIAQVVNDLSDDCEIHYRSGYADDFSSTIDVVREFIDNSALELQQNENLDICCIYPVTPFLEHHYLIDSYNLFKSTNMDYCFAVTNFPTSIDRAIFVENNISKTLFDNEKNRTQDCLEYFYDVGQFYWGSKAAWKKVESIHNNSIVFKIPNYKVIDIDNVDDWKRAEFLYNYLYK